MTTTTTISEGDFNRVVTRINLAITDAILDHQEKDSNTSNEAGRKAISQKYARGILATLGIVVVDQSTFNQKGN